MGAGKSTVGKYLARILGKEFLDCDRQLEEHTGASISLIFDLEGEEGFRKRECAMLDKLTHESGIVLATGGGAVLAEQNRTCLISRGFAIYLNAPVDVLVQRTAQDRNRPLLQTDDPESRTLALLEEREPLYRQVAEMTVNTRYRSARVVAKEILRRIEAL